MAGTRHARKGVTFSDGTRFDAKAVAFNFKKDLASSCTASGARSVLNEGALVRSQDALC